MSAKIVEAAPESAKQLPTSPRREKPSIRRTLDRAGQGMTEYIMIIGLVALLVYAAVQLFGKDIQSLFNKANSDLQQVESSAS